jgi:asparagine synthase (glutamine-hydrolysing)
MKGATYVCGIAGFELDGDDEATAARAQSRLARRGPDDAWFVRARTYGLVQTRLSIIDVSGRVQYPLRNEDGNLALLFNGEIYEHREVRHQLERLGHRFATDCDAEVVVHAFEEWGIRAFERLDGMYAAAIHDEGTGQLTLARDPLGIKPLVYTTAGRFAFSSDVLALVSAGLVDGTIDEPSLADYAGLHYLPAPLTGIRGVSQLLPGHLLQRNLDGSVMVKRWANQPFTVPAPATPVTAAEAGTVLDKCVRAQLAADVSVGVFLSSGLDSSLILDSAVRAGARPTAFTIGFAGHGDYDEVPSAARFAASRGVPHRVAEISAGFHEAVCCVGDAVDQPLGDSSTIATAYLSKFARQEVKVALSGTGGDDLFAGYYRHRAHLLAPVVERIPSSAARALADLRPERGSERRSLLQLGRSYVARLAALGDGTELGHYQELVRSMSSRELPQLIPAVRTSATPRAVRSNHGLRLSECGSILRAIQSLELESYLACDLLVKEDRTSMAVGLEVRVPLLANRMLELSNRTPDAQKISLFAGKRLLREAARRRLPTYVTRARKRGFAVPLASLFAGPWRSEAIEWFREAPPIIDGRGAANLLSVGELPATDAWALAALGGWARSIEIARAEATRTTGTA